MHDLLPDCCAAALAVAMLAAATPSRTVVDAPNYHAAIDSAPAWVAKRLNDGAPLPTPRSGEPVAHLSVEWQVNIALDTMEQYMRAVSVPLTAEGVEQVAELRVDYAPQYQTLVLHEVSVKRGAERTGRLSADNVKLIQREEDLEQRMYCGLVTAVVILSDIRAGDTVACAYTVRGRNPVFGPAYSSYWPLAWGMRVGRTTVRLLAPAKRNLQWRAYNIELKPTVSSSGGLTDYRWQADTLAPVPFEDGCPDWYNPFPHLQVSEYQSWRDVVKWAQGLYERTDTGAAALDSLTKAWRAGGRPDEEAARAALSFVQDEVRYLGVETGVNSHLPSPPSVTLKRRYGDCKDKSLLLVSCLKRMGIKAWPALASMHHGPAAAGLLPCPTVFDHVIVAADIDGQRLWLDPSVTNQKGPLARRAYPDCGLALVVDRRSRDLERVAAPAGYRNTIQVAEEFCLTGYDTPVALTVRSAFDGSQAEQQRAYFASTPAGDIEREYVDYYARTYPGVTLAGEITLEDIADSNRVVVIERYSIPNYCRTSKGRAFVTVNASSVEPFVEPPPSTNRSLPLSLEYPLEVTQTTAVRFPEDIGLETGSTDSVRFEDRAVEYSFTARYADSTLTVDMAFATRTGYLPPAQVAEHAATLRQINDNTSYTVWVPRRDAGEADAVVKKLLGRLRELGEGK